MNPNETVIQEWEEIKALVESLEIDLQKCARKGNKSAAIRVRKGLRLLKAQAAQLVKSTLELPR